MERRELPRSRRPHVRIAPRKVDHLILDEKQKQTDPKQTRRDAESDRHQQPLWIASNDSPFNLLRDR